MCLIEHAGCLKITETLVKFMISLLHIQKTGNFSVWASGITFRKQVVKELAYTN